jgi:hypothetical protein
VPHRRTTNARKCQGIEAVEERRVAADDAAQESALVNRFQRLALLGQRSTIAQQPYLAASHQVAREDRDRHTFARAARQIDRALKSRLVRVASEAPLQDAAHVGAVVGDRDDHR